MLQVLANRTYRHLFFAQVIALVGTGLATVALGLLAYDLAGGEAGAVLGTALAIKMIAYVGVAPIASAFADRLPRRTMLVSLDLVRAAVAIMLPFVTQVWQVYVLIFVLQSASAAFTPTFQATIPDVLPDEQEYTRALSLSRLAYDLENLLSPMLAAALLTIISFHSLFAGTVVGFLASAALVVSVMLPSPKAAERRGIYDRTTRGLRIYLATPRLRGLLALNLAVAAAGAMVIVNTVVLIQAKLGLSQQETALALAAFGGGSMIAALSLPRLLDNISDRSAMLAGAVVLVAGLPVGALINSFGGLLVLWVTLGFGYSLAQTPSGRLLRRSSHPEDRPALFAAQFALSHACWLITYPLAGWLGVKAGLPLTFATLGLIGCVAVLFATRLWPADDPDAIEHVHDTLDENHPHLADAAGVGNHRRHVHHYASTAVIPNGLGQLDVRQTRVQSTRQEAFGVILSADPEADNKNTLAAANRRRLANLGGDNAATDNDGSRHCTPVGAGRYSFRVPLDVALPQAAAAKEKVAVVAIDADPGHFNPGITTGSHVHAAANLIFNGLVGLNSSLSPVPDLALRWHISPDGRIYTFDLAEAKWHDGQPFTSADVKFTFEEILLKYHARTKAGLAAVIEGIDAPHERQVVFRLKASHGAFLRRLDVTEAPILPKHIFAAAGDPNNAPANLKPIGTGPFKLVGYKRDAEIVLERNRDYFKQGLPKLDRLVLRIIKEPATRLLALEQGEVDYLPGVPGNELARLKAKGGTTAIDVTSGPGGGNCIMTVSFNLEREPLKDVNTRKAIARAVDRGRMIEQILFGRGKVAAAPISSAIPWAHAAGALADLSPSLDNANALLDTAGLKRGDGGFD